MLHLQKSELHNRRQLLKRNCENDIFMLLDDSNATMLALFPKAIIHADEKKMTLESVLEYMFTSIKTWISNILNSAISTCETNEYPEHPPEEVAASLQISCTVIKTLLNILSYNRDLSDNDFYFIGDVSSAMGMPPIEVSVIIEQVLYEIRKNFFQSLVSYLTMEECRQCAVLLYKAIHADNYIHPAEFKYFENISQLVNNDQQVLEKVKRDGLVSGNSLKLHLNEEISKYLFRYLTEIVMCDGQFDPRESMFVLEIGKVFGFSKQQQENIIQPVAAAQMVKAALFPR